MEDLKFEIAKKEQQNEILEFLLTYFPEDEPISRSIGMTHKDGYELFKDLVKEGLANPVTFLCPKREWSYLKMKDVVIGCHLNSIIGL